MVSASPVDTITGNWGNRDFRTLVLNAIVWTAHGKVPEGGVPSKDLTVKDLMANQDYEVPATSTRSYPSHARRMGCGS